MKKTYLLIALTIMATACTKRQTTGIDLNNLDTTVVAQNDFYQYATEDKNFYKHHGYDIAGLVRSTNLLKTTENSSTN